MGGIGILGGTFNPVHGAQIRHAVEVRERLNLDLVLLMPNSVPPHKAARGLLPFELRVDLLRAATEGIPGLEISTLEGELEGPSYTWRSLEEFRRRGLVSRPQDLYLMLGVEDFAQLLTWKRGLELPAFANLVVVPRQDSGRQLFNRAGSTFWPEIWPCPVSGPQNDPGRLAGRISFPYRNTVSDPQNDLIRLDVSLEPLFPGMRCIYMPLPRMDITATEIRRRWLARRCLNILVPDAELALMQKHESLLRDIWTDAPGT